MKRSCFKSCFCSKAFTLIELLVVVLIIGVLAAIAVPQYQKAIIKSKTSEAFIVLSALRKAQKVYHLSNPGYASDLTLLDIEIPLARTSTTFLYSNEDDPNTYYFSCKNDGSGCVAMAANKDYPVLQFETGSKSRIMCIDWQNSSIADAICKSMGTYDAETSAANQNRNYYRLN